MAQAQSGDTVTVHYTGRLADESVFDSSREGDPLTFTLGAGQVIQGFEEGVIGMEPGDTRTVTVVAEEAYGPYQDGLVVQVPRSEFPEGVEPEIGQQFHVQQPNTEPFLVTVVEVADDHVTLDANHPLAGEQLTFEIELMKIG